MRYNDPAKRKKVNGLSLHRFKPNADHLESQNQESCNLKQESMSLRRQALENILREWLNRIKGINNHQFFAGFFAEFFATLISSGGVA